MKMTLLNSENGIQQIRQLWPKMRETLDAGRTLIVEVKAETRSQSQNSLIHSIINQVSTQASHLGSSWDAESWKRLLMDTYTREIGQESGKVIPNLTGDGIVQLGLQTRKLTKEQASEFAEWMMAWAAQNGITIREG